MLSWLGNMVSYKDNTRRNANINFHQEHAQSLTRDNVNITNMHKHLYMIISIHQQWKWTKQL